MSSLYSALDFTLRWAHFFIVGFCVLGWAHPDTRIYNLALVFLIALSWFGLGIFRGLGYCLVTDWQWRIKKRLGENLTTDSFVKYELDRLTGASLDEKRVNTFTQVGFYLSATLSVYANYIY